MKKIKKAFFIAWKCAWIIPVIISRIMFCALVGVFDLSVSSAIYAWEETS